MKESQPSLDDWKDLYDAAVKFKELKPWVWMLDSDMFGVQNPENNQIGYCCIMGNLGEHFALGVYLGTEGLGTYLKIQNQEITAGDMEAITGQKCLMASFEDRNYLTNADRDIIKQLGLKFRGRNEWPLFRIYEPGYPPWRLDKEMLKYLTLALQQSIEVALRFKEDPDMLITNKPDVYLVRVPKKSEGDLKWMDKWMKPEPIEKSGKALPPVNEILLQKLKKNVKRIGGVWEADFFFSPTPIKESKDERPYYPYAIIYVDRQSGLILHVNMTKPDEHITAFPSDFMSLVENMGVKPREILVRKEEAFELLELITSRLNIKLNLVKRLDALEQAQASMFQFFC
jgi:hypothetical protein